MSETSGIFTTIFKLDVPEIIFLKLIYGPTRFALENLNYGKESKYMYFI